MRLVILIKRVQLFGVLDDMMLCWKSLDLIEALWKFSAFTRR